MTELKVHSFKASPALGTLIDSLVESMGVSKSKVIRAAIIKLYADEQLNEGTE